MYTDAPREIPKIVVAAFKKQSKYTIAVPYDKRHNFNILISKNKRGGAVPGQKVVVQLYNSADTVTPKGKVVRILGYEGSINAETLGILYQNEIPFEFSERVKKEASAVSSNVSEGEAYGRADYRSLTTVTIDGEDTRDFDDAVTIEKKDGVFRLGVHIADVTHYVRENSALDREALKRGNSVYLPDRVIPMLPFELSNGICSLKSGKDRLALSVIMDVDTFGEVVSHEIHESVINIDKRFTYTEVKNIIEGAKEADPEFMQMFRDMAELAGILSEKRYKKGSLDFDVAESRVILDKAGNIAEICAYERNVATRIIEEFMVLCNETVAERFFWSEVPFVYRTHEPPDTEKTIELAEFLKDFGLSVKGGRNSLLHPKELQKILSAAEGSLEERIIKKALLRTMKQARYSSRNAGHFGLSLSHYCHFTSPIRRYADLQIHRIIKECLSNGISANRGDKLTKRVGIVAERTSKTERAAETAEREAIKLWKCVYMQDKIGMESEGVVSYVARHGIYVELQNTVEGMVSLHTMNDDYYIYDNGKFTGENTQKSYRAGDRVAIKVKGVSIKDRFIDFIFI